MMVACEAILAAPQPPGTSALSARCILPWSFGNRSAREMSMTGKVARYDQPPKADETEALRLAEQTDLSPDQARELIRRHGNDHAKLLEIARTMKSES